MLPCLLLVLFFYLLVKHISSKHHELPPGPFPWPIVGNIFQIGKKPHLSLANLAATHGHLLSLRLGQQLLVVGSSPAAAAQILKIHDRALSGRYLPMVASKIPHVTDFSVSLSPECNSNWKFLRSVSHTGLFSAKALAMQAKWRERKVREMVEYLSKRCRERGVVKLEEVVLVTITNALSNILVSRDLISFEGRGDENARMKTYIRGLVELPASPSLADLYTGLSRLDVWSKHKAIYICQTNKLVWGDIVQARRQGQSGDVSAPDFLDILIQNHLCDDNINILLTELLTAGTDTSSTTIQWTLAELIRNERAMHTLRAELTRTIDGDDLIKESHLSHLKYLHACVKEALRLHPPGPFLMPHRALHTCKVMGYTIPKDSLVAVNVGAVGRDPTTWDDPLSFRPERFLDSDLDFKGSSFQFIPFSAGRRICPGLPVAVRQVELVLAYLVHYFDWFLPGGIDPSDLDMAEKFGMSLHMEKPLALIPRIRKRIRE